MHHSCVLLITGQTGFVPAAFLEVIGDAPEVGVGYEEVATNETSYQETEAIPEPTAVCSSEPVLGRSL